MLRLGLLMLVATASLAAQPRPPIPGSGQSVTANERYVYVLRGDQLFQFDATTLQLLNATRLPPAPGRAVARQGVRVQLKVPEAEPEPEMVEEEPPEEEPVLRDTEVVEEIVEEVTEEGQPGGRAGLAARGGRRSARAIERALVWLKRHQDEDGKWDADGFMKHDVDGEPTDGAGNPMNDVGVTGLALLAYLGDGSTLRSGPYRDQVKRAVSWLRNQQDKTGLFGSQQSHDFIYSHAIATLAMTEAYGLSNYKLLQSTAQKAINYLERHRNPYSVWRYQPRDNDNDMSVTAWCVMAYKAASDFDLQVNGNAMKLAEAWIDQVTDPENGRTGYSRRGESSSRPAGDFISRFPPEKNEAMTSAALFCRFLLGQKPAEQKIMKKSADLVLKKAPRWDPKAGSVDFYAWYFGSMAMYQMGGRHWKGWSRAMSSALLTNQDRDGSWDPVGPWSESGGRIYSTALSTLALESYYRYSRLVR